jgi:hypothetical protein
MRHKEEVGRDLGAEGDLGEVDAALLLDHESIFHTPPSLPETQLLAVPGRESAAMLTLS